MVGYLKLKSNDGIGNISFAYEEDGVSKSMSTTHTHTHTLCTDEEFMAE